jgi:HD-GYP domain-containing protein (c-di-GMP phosphodiesterase class II)
MATGDKNVPGFMPQVNVTPMPITDNLKQNFANMSTAANSESLFGALKAAYTTSPSYSSVLPSVQGQLGQMGQYIQPQIDAIKRGGEVNAASQQSDAMARGLRGSDIEASGMQAARSDASAQEAQLRGQVGMQQAQLMAEYIMKTYGYDIEQNSKMYTELAQAIGQKMQMDQEMQMFQQQLAAYKKAQKQQSQNQMWSSFIQAAPGVASLMMPAKPKV